MNEPNRTVDESLDLEALSLDETGRVPDCADVAAAGDPLEISEPHGNRRCASRDRELLGSQFAAE